MRTTQISSIKRYQATYSTAAYRIIPKLKRRAPRNGELEDKWIAIFEKLFGGKQPALKRLRYSKTIKYQTITKTAMLNIYREKQTCRSSSHSFRE
uniref:Uncharacterized protein n=1 Tax=Bionectria ochroleuca TaxID=29856 RepID=A0A0B7KPA4_BIOOC